MVGYDKFRNHTVHSTLLRATLSGVTFLGSRILHHVTSMCDPIHIRVMY